MFLLTYLYQILISFGGECNTSCHSFYIELDLESYLDTTEQLIFFSNRTLIDKNFLIYELTHELQVLSGLRSKRFANCIDIEALCNIGPFRESVNI